MPLSDWSENIVIGEMTDEPTLGDELKLLLTRAEMKQVDLHFVLEG